MYINEKVIVNKESLDKMQTKLRGLKVIVKDKQIQSLVSEILELIDDELNAKDISVEEIIKDKMKETKFSNPELHFELYKLYRKLTDGKIDEAEALKAYHLYTSI